jgi:CRP/FNR family transcriptional regulator, cyclic AMP receptor protein
MIILKLIMDEVFADGTEEFFIRGDIIATNGKVSLIKSGVVGIFTEDEGHNNLLFVYKAGEFFPYPGHKLELISGRKIEYRSMDNTSVLTVTSAHFNAEAYRPENLRPFIESLMEMMSVQIDRIDNLQQGQVFNRLLERLNFFAKRLGVRNGDKIVIEVPMSHVDIASSIGTSRETVNRLMRKLEKTGVITVKKQTIIINSMKGLRDLLEQPTEREEKSKRLMIASLAVVATEALLAAQSVN